MVSDGRVCEAATSISAMLRQSGACTISRVSPPDIFGQTGVRSMCELDEDRKKYARQLKRQVPWTLLRQIAPGRVVRTGRSVSFTSFVALVGLCISSHAIPAAVPSPEVKKTCGAEIRAMCLRPWRLTPDAISACVEENHSKLSPTCQAFWQTAHMCQLEMKNVCGGLNPFTIKSCLKNSRSQFSQTCQRTLDTD